MKKKGLRLLALAVVMLVLLLPGGYFDRGLLSQEKRFKHLTVGEAAAMLQVKKNEPDFVLLDVRTPQEFAGERLENAVNLDYYGLDFRESLDRLDKGKVYLVYCRTGRRSSLTLMIMEELGFREAYNVLGGIVQWKAEGLPL